MRAYFFGNTYLSSLQQGLQAGHVIADMFMKYQFDSSARTKYLSDWAADHKTIILLNGGYGKAIRDLLTFLGDKRNPFPFAYFNESDEALDGALTSVGIILPEHIYVTAALVRSRELDIEQIKDDGYCVIPLPDSDTTYQKEFDKWEVNLIERLNQFGMAR